MLTTLRFIFVLTLVLLRPQQDGYAYDGHFTLAAETVTAGGTADAAQLAKLKDLYRQMEKYGADGGKELENGRIRRAKRKVSGH